MQKRIMIILISLAFLSSSLILLASCKTKPQPPIEEKIGPAPEEQKGREISEEDLAALDAKRQKEEKAKRYAELFRAFETENIYFAFDRSDLSDKAKETLKRKAEWLAENSEKVRIEGHCDERGSNAYNLALGHRRASSAKKYLVALGISSGRVYTVSYGEEKPADRRHNETAWAMNRRDEFKLTK
jgi:peptidoglycan-associated lipoprotein